MNRNKSTKIWISQRLFAQYYDIYINVSSKLKHVSSVLPLNYFLIGLFSLLHQARSPNIYGNFLSCFAVQLVNQGQKMLSISLKFLRKFLQRCQSNLLSMNVGKVVGKITKCLVFVFNLV